MTTSAHRPVIFGRPCFDDAEEDAVLDVVRSRWIGQGPLTQRFEQELAAYVGAEDVVAVSSCTAALHLSLVALGIGPGDEVITTPFTFVATVNAIEHAGGTPVFVDIDPQTLNITPEAVEQAITPRTRAVMPVHFGGRPLDLAGFHGVIERHDLWLIEDAAHAVGGVAAGARVGGSRHPRSLACFSFYPNKNLATAEGGAIAGPAGEVMDRLRQLRLHGLDSDAWDRFRTTKFRLALATAPGFKANMTDLQAAIALPQLAKLEGFLATREHLAARYDELLAEADLVRPVARPRATLHERHALHLYQVQLAPGLDRDAIVAALQARSIGVAVHYIGVNLHPYYAPKHPEVLPHSDAASHNLISLPLHPGLAEDDLRTVVTALQEEIAAQSAAGVTVALPTQRAAADDQMVVERSLA